MRACDWLEVEDPPTQPQPLHQLNGVGHGLSVQEHHEPIALVVTGLCIIGNVDFGERPSLRGGGGEGE